MTTSRAPGARPALPPWLVYMLGASFFFSVMSVFAKVAGARLPAIEVVFGRSVITTGLTYGALRRRKLDPRGNDTRLLILRGLVGFAALVCFFYAVTRLPLADVTVIHFTSPVFTVFIAGIALHEGLRRREVVSAFVCLAGIVLVARPGFLFGGAGLDPAATGIAIVGAFLAAIAFVLVRKLGRSDDSLVIVFWFSVVCLLGSAPFGAVFVAPAPWELAALLGVGIATQVGQVLVTRALVLERPGKAMQVGYIQILFAAVWGLVLFQEIPRPSAVLGALVVVVGLVSLTLPRAAPPWMARVVRRPFAVIAPPPPAPPVFLEDRE